MHGDSQEQPAARPFDLQVNGYGGVDFNKDDLTADELHAACAKLEADGVGGVLATIITESVESPDTSTRIVPLLEPRVVPG